jgi:hypothetical protein
MAGLSLSGMDGRSSHSPPWGIVQDNLILPVENRRFIPLA